MNWSEDNRVRYPADGKGHVESWFVRANDPSRRRAFWLKTTMLEPLEGEAVAEVWACTFDGKKTWGGRETVAYEDGALAGPLRVGRCVWDLEGGSLRGLIGDRGFELTMRRPSGGVAGPLCMMPTRKMETWAVPRSKLLTPGPHVIFEGTMRWGDEDVVVDGWHGMLGHNWGREHAHTYAWGQCLFADDEGVHTMVEGFSGKLELGGRVTPWISGLVVRRGEREYRWVKLLDLWRQDATVERYRWKLRMHGSAGVAELTMRADPEELVCLGYGNPNGVLSYCFNSKLAEVELKVNPSDGEGFTCRSAHGGALELLDREPDLRFSEVV